MSFDFVIGQHRPKKIIRHALQQNRVPHAYLFQGPPGVGKEALTLEFTKALFCSGTGEKPCDTCSACKRISNLQHPDVMYIFPSSGDNFDERKAVLQSVAAEPYARQKPWAAPLITIEMIREIRHKSSIKPVEGKLVVIIAEADHMNVQAANALLKILEEPPSFMHLVLTASQPNAMLPTILSRCQEIRLGPLKDTDIEQALIERKLVEPEKAKLFAKASQGSYGRALEWLNENFAGVRDEAVDFLRVCLRNPKSQMEEVESIIKKYDKGTIKKMLSLLLLWYRDSMMLSTMTDTANAHSTIVNADSMDTLQNFNSAFESINYQTIFEQIERSIYMIERNIQMNLILIVLFNKLRQAMKLKH